MSYPNPTLESSAVQRCEKAVAKGPPECGVAQARQMPPARIGSVRPVLAVALALGSVWWLTACSPTPDEGADDPHAGHAHAAPVTTAAAGTEGIEMCLEHGVPEAECGICRPDLVDALQPGQRLQIRLGSPEAAARAGIETAPAEVAEVAEGVDCLAELAFNQTRQARITAPVEGFVESVDVDLGSRVEEGDRLARLLSPAIAEAVAGAVLTHQTLERERRLRAERVTSEEDLQRAEAQHRSACQQLRVLGFTEAQIDELGANPDQPVLLPIRAPFAGEVARNHAVRGARVAMGEVLFEVVDPSLLWAMLKVPESELGRIRLGLPVELTVAAHPGRKFSGRLTWVAPEIDERTRMVSVRAEIPNPEGRLKAGMFGRARILTGGPSTAVVIPAEAVQRIEGRPFAFVAVAPDLFEARALGICSRHGDHVEVLAGLQPGERVAVAGSYQVKSQLLLSRLGAGCTHE